jgi:hypothetical protein
VARPSTDCTAGAASDSQDCRLQIEADLRVRIDIAERATANPLSSYDTLSWKLHLSDATAAIEWRYVHNFPYTVSHERRLRQAHQTMNEFLAAMVCAPGLSQFLPHDPKEYSYRTHVQIVSELNDTKGFFTPQIKWVRGETFTVHTNCSHCCCKYCSTCSELHEDWIGCCQNCGLCWDTSNAVGHRTRRAQAQHQQHSPSTLSTPDPLPTLPRAFMSVAKP